MSILHTTVAAPIATFKEWKLVTIKNKAPDNSTFTKELVLTLM